MDFRRCDAIADREEREVQKETARKEGLELHPRLDEGMGLKGRIPTPTVERRHRTVKTQTWDGGCLT